MIILQIPNELRDELDNFLEVCIASVTAYPDDLTSKEWKLVEIIKTFIEEPTTPDEVFLGWTQPGQTEPQ